MDIEDQMADKPYFVHESAYVDEPCSIGKGTKIWHFSHIMKNSRIGEGCNIGQNVVISPDVVIGSNVKIQNNVSVYTGCILEDDVFCGPSMVFTNVINPRSHVARKDEYKTTLVSQGASLGANCTVVCGTSIGRYAFVGAGSVVTRDVPDYALVYGNPARVRGWMCACGLGIEFNGQQESAVCKTCGAAYTKSGDRVVPVGAEKIGGNR
jgi:UDP-2-acetamido-3-amino-2,3-dideoxy-glucuronate N-acetyltransferase